MASELSIYALGHSPCITYQSFYSLFQQRSIDKGLVPGKKGTMRPEFRAWWMTLATQLAYVSKLLQALLALEEKAEHCAWPMAPRYTVTLHSQSMQSTVESVKPAE